MAVAPTCCCSAIGRGHRRSSCRYGRGLSCVSLAPRRRLYRVLWHNVAIPLSNCCCFCLLYTSTSTHYILVHSPSSSTYFSSVLFWQLVAHWKQLLEAPLDTAKLLFFAEEEKRQQRLLAVYWDKKARARTRFFSTRAIAESGISERPLFSKTCSEVSSAAVCSLLLGRGSTCARRVCSIECCIARTTGPRRRAARAKQMRVHSRMGRKCCPEVGRGDSSLSTDIEHEWPVVYMCVILTRVRRY